MSDFVHLYWWLLSLASEPRATHQRVPQTGTRDEREKESGGGKGSWCSTVWDGILVLPLSGCAMLGNSYHLLSLDFLLWKMGTRTAIVNSHGVVC